MIKHCCKRLEGIIGGKHKYTADKPVPAPTNVYSQVLLIAKCKWNNIFKYIFIDYKGHHHFKGIAIFSATKFKLQQKLLFKQTKSIFGTTARAYIKISVKY